MSPLALALLLCAPAPAAGVKASSMTLALVELFLETPTADLPRDQIPLFVTLDPDSLPKRLQIPYKAKRLQLYELRQLADGKKKGNIRTPEKECAPPSGSKSADLEVLLFQKKLGFIEEILTEEEDFLEQKTKCTELELVCEFSMQVALEKDRKGKIKRKRYFLSPSDPLMSIIGLYRNQSKAGGQSNFFGIGGPLCSH